MSKQESKDPFKDWKMKRHRACERCQDKKAKCEWMTEGAACIRCHSRGQPCTLRRTTKNATLERGETSSSGLGQRSSRSPRPLTSTTRRSNNDPHGDVDIPIDPRLLAADQENQRKDTDKGKGKGKGKAEDEDEDTDKGKRKGKGKGKAKAEDEK
ncbi:uncharacterized protein PV06_08529 [Exophiala oligosperma]|uniref:Zn(2)-C6 fungal-type domain-containing protein n=1 Tax=Exophiala oligosperma TaxID=215243 RepID=A0A0D2DC14_9EURO|nr:uncharacterized protein PV06_08529 [Exophiala oligosperma]KIW39970.1 hypothetical protein PV06_08529 [Exophiala oligosperma]